MLTIGAGFLAGVQAASLWYWGQTDQTEERDTSFSSQIRERSRSETTGFQDSDLKVLSADHRARSVDNLSINVPNLVAQHHKTVDNSFPASPHNTLQLIEQDIPSTWCSTDKLSVKTTPLVNMSASLTEIHNLGSLLCEGLSRVSSEEVISSNCESYTTTQARSSPAIQIKR
eukprot:sb/3472123/